MSKNIILGIMMLGLASGCNFRVSQDEVPTHGPATVAARTLEAVFTNIASKTEQVIQDTQPHGLVPEDTQTYPPPLEEVCTNRALFVDDITIRDNMQIERGSSFMKVWRLRNDGTCVWNRAYNLTFFGGERMEAPHTIPLQEIVQPGQTIDLAIDLTAPEEPGTYQGFWRLQSEDGDYFGIGSEGDHSFWVIISVVVSQDSTPTSDLTSTLTPSETPSPSETLVPTETPTPSATPQPPPSVYCQGEVWLSLGQDVDLDTGQISPIHGEDIAFAEEDASESSLKPQNTALLAIFSGAQQPPTESDCERTPKSSEAIPLGQLAVSDILCYSTDEGRLGYLSILELDASLVFSFTTWVP